MHGVPATSLCEGLRYRLGRLLSSVHFRISTLPLLYDLFGNVKHFLDLSTKAVPRTRFGLCLPDVPCLTFSLLHDKLCLQFYEQRSTCTPPCGGTTSDGGLFSGSRTQVFLFHLILV